MGTLLLLLLLALGIVAAAAALPMRCQFENAMKNSKSIEREDSEKSEHARLANTSFTALPEVSTKGVLEGVVGAKGKWNASLANATRRCVCCMYVYVCVCAFIIKPSSAQGARESDRRKKRQKEREGRRLWEWSQLQWLLLLLLSLTAKFMWLFMHFN